MAQRLVVFEVVSFAFCLLTSLAMTLKLFLYGFSQELAAARNQHKLKIPPRSAR
ncbi:hypothetical protein Pint_03099 [Pistacia integerrima]|uniref:Uncharacterized protein n=1 Tax=Pistacia integerrima TaxID=434235 RepID=A0ACC0ZGN1_9ROSI|nr:hypothetical protein Pint_03099 [Pistacia integerrima]